MVVHYGTYVPLKETAAGKRVGRVGMSHISSPTLSHLGERIVKLLNY
jgi:hypothetical protein